MLRKYKLFESVSKIWADRKRGEGCIIIGYEEARKLWDHIGKDIIFDVDQKGVLKGIEPLQRGRWVKYYAVIEIKRASKTFTSRRMVKTVSIK